MYLQQNTYMRHIGHWLILLRHWLQSMWPCEQAKIGLPGRGHWKQTGHSKYSRNSSVDIDLVKTLAKADDASAPPLRVRGIVKRFQVHCLKFSNASYQKDQSPVLKSWKKVSIAVCTVAINSFLANQLHTSQN